MTTLRLSPVLMPAAVALLLMTMNTEATLDAAETRSNSARQANVVFILADDMNYGCCCGEDIARKNTVFQGLLR